MAKSKAPVASATSVAAPVSPVDSPETTKVHTKPGPKVHRMPDLAPFVETLAKLSPKERKAHRTKTAETMLDLFCTRMLDMLASPSCRSQTLLVAANFFKSNSFQVEPDAEGVEDPLDKLIRKRKADEAEEAARLKRIARAKQAEEERVEKFYAKQSGGPITPRLNAGDPGPINVEGESFDE